MFKRIAVPFILLAASMSAAPSMAATAVAADATVKKFGYCSAKSTVAEAESCAQAKCAKAGGRQCVIVDSTNQSGGFSAIASSKRTLGTFLNSQNDEEMVSFYAMRDCVQKETGCDMLTDKCTNVCKIVAKWQESGAEQAEQTLPPPPNNIPPPVLPSQIGGQPATQNNSASASFDGVLAQANNFYRAKNYRAAVVAYTQAIKLNPESYAAWASRGISQAKLGQAHYVAARNDLTQALRIRPDDGNVYFLRGVLNQKTGHSAEAEADIRKSAQLGNANAQAVLNVATKESGANQPEAATGGMRHVQVGGIAHTQLQGITHVQVGGIAQTEATGIDPAAVGGMRHVQAGGIKVRPGLIGKHGNNIDEEAAIRAAKIDPNGQGLNQAQINAMEMQRQLMWNSTGPGMVYTNPWH